nr:PREDICTED: uncharacterized protein LOC100878352 [Megachile rotundata]
MTILNASDSDSSSSEDETLQNALKEAVDNQFFENVNESPTKSESDQEQNKTSSKSLRENLSQKNEFSNFGVTPTFQNYVAKKLNEILEKSVEINDEVEDDTINEKESEGNDCGIKLLNSSGKFIVTKEKEEIHQKRRIVDIDDEANYLKCKEVAVDSEWILSKIETKFWTSKRKEPEFKYKRLKTGVLVEKS